MLSISFNFMCETTKMNKPVKIGVLLSNLGTPDAPTSAAVSKYLKQFLADLRVIDFTNLAWKMLLNYRIIPKRSPKVAKLYSSIWTDKGSPLLKISLEQQQKLQQLFTENNINAVVELGMSYGNPSMQQAVDNLIAQKVDKIIVLPLYPQYSSTTTASVLDAFALALTAHRFIPEFEFIHSYHDNADYIDALTKRIANIYAENDKPHVFFSFHGIPLRYEQLGDFYRDQCINSANLVAQKLGIKENEFTVAFQSLFGKEEWLKPYTDVTLEEMPKKGIKNLIILCPGFSVDCLETLEEINQENRENFTHAGGENYHYIPCLNSDDDHIEMMYKLISKRI